MSSPNGDAAPARSNVASLTGSRPGLTARTLDFSGRPLSSLGCDPRALAMLRSSGKVKRVRSARVSVP